MARMLLAKAKNKVRSWIDIARWRPEGQPASIPRSNTIPFSFKSTKHDSERVLAVIQDVYKELARMIFYKQMLSRCCNRRIYS